MTFREQAFDAVRLLELLTELNRRLEISGTRADIYLVGGAAIALNMTHVEPRTTSMLSTRQSKQSTKWLLKWHLIGV